MVVRESFVIKYWGKYYLFSAFNSHIAGSKNLTSFSFCWGKYFFLLLFNKLYIYIYIYMYIYIFILYNIYFNIFHFINLYYIYLYIYIYIYMIYIYIYLIYFHFEKVFTVIYWRSLVHAFIFTQIDLTIDFTTGCSQQ